MSTDQKNPLNMNSKLEKETNLVSIDHQKSEETLVSDIYQFINQHKNDFNDLKKEILLVKTKQNTKIKDVFVSWCQKSDINGLSKIFDYENNLIRFIWTIILLASIAITAWIMSSSIIAYYEYSVVSQISIVYEQPTEFPSVTFCDNYQFTTVEGIEFVKSFKTNKSNANLTI